MAALYFSPKSKRQLLLLLSALVLLQGGESALPVLCTSEKQGLPVLTPFPALPTVGPGTGGGTTEAEKEFQEGLKEAEEAFRGTVQQAIDNFGPLPTVNADDAQRLAQAVAAAAQSITMAITQAATRPGVTAESLADSVQKAVQDFAQKIAETLGDGAGGVDRVRQMLNEALGLNDGGGNECFPAGATVLLEEGGRRRMDGLRIGDRVHVGGGEFSEVFLFTHRDAGHRGKFVEIETERGGEAGPVLRVTGGHYLYRDAEMVEARKIRVGDRLADGALECTANGAPLVVRSVRLVNDEGLYNPQTRHGDIVVNGVRATTFTRAVHPTLAQVLLKPLEVLFRLGALSESTAGKAFMCGRGLPSMGPQGWQCA